MSEELEKKLDAELEEAKATGEDSMSADAVAPEGGTPKKRKADVNKKVDAKADEIEDHVKTPQGTNDTGMKESAGVEALFSGEDLSEDFKTKVEAVFEAAIHEKELSLREELEEKFASDLDEEVAKATDELIEKVDSYLDYVIEQWMEQNEVAVESAIKVEVAESLLNSLKGLVEDHNLEIDDEQVDAVAELESRLSEQQEKYNSTVEEMIAIKESKETLEREIALKTISESLTDTQADKLALLAEGVSFKTTDDFKAKVEAIKESYFAETVETPADETEYLEEETLDETTKVDPLAIDEGVSRYAAALDRLAKK